MYAWKSVVNCVALFKISVGSCRLWLEVVSDALAMDESELDSVVNALFVLAGMPRRWFFLKKFLVPITHHFSHPSLHFKLFYRRIFKLLFLPRIVHTKKACKKHETACEIYSPFERANYLLPK